MTTRLCIVKNPTGIHTRPSRNFVDTATKDYPACTIQVTKNGKTINGKSVLAMLTLGARFGDEILVSAEGEGEVEAVGILGDIFEKLYLE